MIIKFKAHILDVLKVRQIRYDFLSEISSQIDYFDGIENFIRISPEYRDRQ